MFLRIFDPKPTIAGLAALLLTAAAGTAADLDTDIPGFRPAIHQWTGPYAGVVAGGGFLDTFYLPSGNPDPELAGDGYLLGGLVGYNLQVDNIVLGVEGDLSAGKVSATNSLDQVNYKVPMLATARLRAGYAFDDTLVFATGGLAVARGDMYLPGFGESDEKTHYGYTVGGGMEHAVTENLNIRLEYLYASLGKKTYDFSAGTVRMGLDDLHNVRAGLTWNFLPGGF